MSSQSGSRFSSSTAYQQPSPYYAPPVETHPTVAAPSYQGQTYPPPNQQPPPYVAPSQFQAPVSNNVEFLLAQYAPEERLKIKNENAQKYGMSSDSLIYKLPPRYLESLVSKYPQEFPQHMRDDLKKSIGKLRRDYSFFSKMLWGGVLYWAVLRRQVWFQLTGNAIMRVCWAFICFNNMIDLTFAQNEFLTQNAFQYNSHFESVLARHNINPTALSKDELLS